MFYAVLFVLEFGLSAIEHVLWFTKIALRPIAHVPHLGERIEHNPWRIEHVLAITEHVHGLHSTQPWIVSFPAKK